MKKSQHDQSQHGCLNKRREHGPRKTIAKQLLVNYQIIQNKYRKRKHL